ncbi:MAG TPA: ABC transporter permease [Gemmatimonadaceae bacterium]|jgi:Acidobacterial duplicated orphan permease
MNDFLLDIRDAARSLRRNPWFTATVVIILSLGIGANTAIFGLVNAVMLQPLPYPDSDRIVSIAGGSGEVIDVETVRAVLEEPTHSFGALAAYDADGANLTGGGEPERVKGSGVTSQFFQVIGVNPALGRAFSPGEFRDSSAGVVMIADGLWKRDFGADPAIIGRTIKLDDRGYVVIGVMPAGFGYPRGADYWLPLQLPQPEAGTFYYTFLVGRLRPGIPLDAARSEFTSLLHAHASELRRDYEKSPVSMVSLHERMYGDLRPALSILLGAVGCVLLIACANVANLLLARAAGQRRDLAVRAALGAGRARLVRQLLVESVMLSFLGGLLGLVIAMNALDVFAAAAPARLARVPAVTLDGRVLLFAFAASLSTGLLFGLAPAFSIARSNLNDILKDGGSRRYAGGGSGNPRRVLVAAELAIAVVLLIGAGLLVKSFVRFSSVESGFQSNDVLRASITLPSARYSNPALSEAFFRDALARIREIPGVEAATLSDISPLGGSVMTRTRTTDSAGMVKRSPMIAVGTVATDYFRTYRIPLLTGRDFTIADGATAPRVAVVNESLARYFFEGKSAIGEQLSIGASAPYTIVGVVADVRMGAPRPASPPAVYFPSAQSDPSRYGTISVRTRSDPLALVPSLRAAVRSVDPEQPIANVTTMDEVLSEFMAPRRFNALLLGSFAALALTLAVLGLYGVISYIVTQRTREIGIRMALGADRRDVVQAVLRQGIGLAVAGVIPGIAAALALRKLLAGLLFRVESGDPMVFAVVPLVLLSVAALAIVIPARRASRVDPTVALRAE